MSYKNGLFIFRRDYRIVDNVSLHLANEQCENIYPIFIFTPEQVGRGNEFKSNNAIQFMIESLTDLSTAIKSENGKLYTFYGNNNSIISECIERLHIDAVYFNCDYSPYAIDRDTSINNLCESKKIKCFCYHDYYLNPPGTIFNGSGDPYKKFTPYYTVAIKRIFSTTLKKYKINFSKTHTFTSSHDISIKEAMDKFTHINDNILVKGGRKESILVLKNAVKLQKHFSKTHDTLIIQTSLLSAYIKFGCVSIREVYNSFKGNHKLIRQLIWRDFYASILYSFPRVIGHSLNPKYDKISWKRNNSHFEMWKHGVTGFPVVDAGMRELNKTGYMHNRARLIVASFLVKTLLINWKEGEKYFASKLTDYDVASNNGNWQWVMGGGADSQPYFRIFNPWNQSREYDHDALYIKKWIPELNDVPTNSIHNWYIDCENEKYKNVKYPWPIVEYAEQKKYVLHEYSLIFK